MKPILLGVADTIESEFEPEFYKTASPLDKYFKILFRSVDKLCGFLGTDRVSLAPYLTDFVSVDAHALGRQGFCHAVSDANDLGFSGISCHTIDLGGASIGGALQQAYTIVSANPDAVVLVAAADVPKSVFRHISDLKRLSALCHEKFELPYGATLNGFYSLLAERQMKEANISFDDYKEITNFFRSNALDNPRAFQFAKEITEKQISRPLAGPYSAPMIAIVTDHGIATLITSEAKKQELIEKGILRKDANHIFITGASHAVHAEYFYQKKAMASPAAIACERAFALSGYSQTDVEYAWIYDCFTGMIIHQASQYFGSSAKENAVSLKTGKITNGDKKIPINLGGGILNYQAAMALSGATGLIDIASQYDLAVNPISKKLPSPPKVSLLGGNGGIDSTNAVIVFATQESPKPSRKPFLSNRIFVNEVDAVEGEECLVLSATTVFFNPGGDKKPPYVLCTLETKRGSMLLTNLFDKDDKELFNHDGIEIGKSIVSLKLINGNLQAVMNA